MSLARLHEVRRVYGDGASSAAALDGVTLSLEHGSLTVVLGPSGSGKSTFLNVLGALDRPTSGSVVVDGVPLQESDDATLAALRRDRLGFVFQFFNLLPELSAWENVALPRLAAGRPLDEGRDRAHDLLEQVSLGHRASHRPNQLSGGEMQRVAVARALMNDPILVLADEPTGNLDSKSGAAVLDLLRTVPVSGQRAVVMVTHDRTVAELADRVLEFADGRVVHDTAVAVRAPARSSRRRRPLGAGA